MPRGGKVTLVSFLNKKYENVSTDEFTYWELDIRGWF